MSCHKNVKRRKRYPSFHSSPLWNGWHFRCET